MAATVAGQRWRMLRAAIRAGDGALPEAAGVSKRAGQPEFDLFASVHVHMPASSTDSSSSSTDGPGAGIVKEYRVTAEGPAILVRELRPRASFRASFDEYSGFLNTGNICVWPAEQILAAYVARRPELVRGRRVLELGAGMTGMAALAAAIYGQPTEVCITDGHPACVANIASTVQLNAGHLACPVHTEQLLWSVDAPLAALDGACDLVLLADCFFVSDLHPALVHILRTVLTQPAGRALGLAPPRGGSLRRFEAAARAGGLEVRVDDAYEPALFRQHEQRLAGVAAGNGYDPDTHYPLLVTVSRPSP